MRGWILFCLLLITGITFAQDEPEHILAIAAVPPLDPPPETLSPNELVKLFTDTLQTSVEAGANGELIAKTWSELESGAGAFTLDDFTGDITYRRTAYRQTFFVGIQLVNTLVKDTPPDLLDVAFDDPRMIERFKALIDALLPYFETDVRYLSIGNEVDVYLENHNQWEAYKTFYDAAVAYVHEVAPWIKVGVTFTYGGTKTMTDKVRALNEVSDVVILTYYPLESDLHVQPPDAPLQDFPAMLALTDDKPLILQEVGYPSAEQLGSSEAKQAEFVTHVYEAWDQAGDRIPFLSFFAMGDFSDQLTEQLSGYYGITGADNFTALLRTLGLRQVDGTPKLGWQAFVEGAAQAGFS